MNSLIRVLKKGQVTIPDHMRAMIGLSEGDYVRVIMRGRTLVIQPASAIRKSDAVDEYTQAQRRLIAREIAKSKEDFKEGRVHGPFGSAKEACAYIENAAKQRPPVQRSKRPVR